MIDIFRIHTAPSHHEALYEALLSHLDINDLGSYPAFDRGHGYAVLANSRMIMRSIDFSQYRSYYIPKDQIPSIYLLPSLGSIREFAEGLQDDR